ncbi:MAG: hypothetical protein ABSB22_25085 [Thermodesulfobacteriota bacterium]|jgi:hypothetical protein
MSLAIIDAREWQNMFDLRTGKKAQGNGAVVQMVKGVLERHPYPGDIDLRSNQWVTDTALDLTEKYEPRFVFLSYAQQYFSARYAPMTHQERTDMISAVFTEAERFTKESGFTPIVVGTGDMTDFQDFIDVSRLDGLAISTHWSARYAGLHGPSPSDLSRLKENPQIDWIVPREELLALFNGSPEDGLRVPDYLLLAREGYLFKTAGTTLRKSLRIPATSFRIPVFTELGSLRAITDIRGLTDIHLKDRKIVLIILEGIGMKEFPWSYSPCENGKGWYYYEPGDAQYLTITAGKHRVFDYPTGYKYFEEDGEKKEYPFSGYFRSIPDDTLASQFPGKSIVVGNRSMLMHMVVGADISLECFARNLYNQGTMAVIHRQDK